MNNKNFKKLIILSSPSGGGKSTIARYILKNYKNVYFSISATTRNKRPGETYGVEYYFLSVAEFQKKILQGELIEYEEIFGNYYGTLRAEVNKALISDMYLLFDIDVNGALSIQEAYPDNSLLIFLEPPSIDTLEERLRKRATETEDQIKKRMERVRDEMGKKNKFDYVILNENLDTTYKAIDDILTNETLIEKNIELKT